MVVRELVTRLGFDDVDMAKLYRADRAVTQFANRLNKIGKKMSLMITAPLVGIGIGAFKMSMNLNRSMANIGTLIPGNIERLESLKKTIQGLSVEFGLSTDDIAAGLYQIISAYGDTEDTEKKLRINTMLAVAGLSTVADALNLTSAVTKSYGDTTAEATEKVGDLVFKTIELGQTTLPELSPAIQDVAPLAATLKVKIEELFTAFATLTGVTGNTNIVGTQLNAILRAMIRPTEKMKLAIKRLGYEDAKTMIQQLGMVKALRLLVNTTDGSAESVAELFGRAEALTAVFPLISTLVDTFAWKQREMNKAAGAATLAFKQQAEGINKVGFQFEQTKQRIAVAAQKLGDTLGEKGLFDQIIKRIEQLTGAIVKASPETIQFFTDLGIAIATIGPALIILSKVVKAVQALIPFLRAGAALLTAALPFIDYLEWKKGEVSVLGDLFGEYPGPFSKEKLTAAVNDWIKVANTIATAGLNYLAGWPEPFGYLPTPGPAVSPGYHCTIENFTLTVPEGTPETLTERIRTATEQGIQDGWQKAMRDLQRNNPKIE